jgi:hypothetical protein
VGGIVTLGGRPIVTEQKVLAGGLKGDIYMLHHLPHCCKALIKRSLVSLSLAHPSCSWWRRLVTVAVRWAGLCHA